MQKVASGGDWHKIHCVSIMRHNSNNSLEYQPDKDEDLSGGENEGQDEFFGEETADEGLDESETDESADEGAGDGKIGRSRDDLFQK